MYPSKSLGYYGSCLLDNILWMVLDRFGKITSLSTSEYLFRLLRLMTMTFNDWSNHIDHLIQDSMIQDTVKTHLLILLETISFLSNIVLFLGKLVSHY